MLSVSAKIRNRYLMELLHDSGVIISYESFRTLSTTWGSSGQPVDRTWSNVPISQQRVVHSICHGLHWPRPYCNNNNIFSWYKRFHQRRCSSGLPGTHSNIPPAYFTRKNPNPSPAKALHLSSLRPGFLTPHLTPYIYVGYILKIRQCRNNIFFFNLIWSLN